MKTHLLWPVYLDVKNMISEGEAKLFRVWGNRGGSGECGKSDEISHEIVVIWKHFCFILSTGTKIRTESVMRPRSSSRGRNTSASVTVYKRQSQQRNLPRLRSQRRLPSPDEAFSRKTCNAASNCNFYKIHNKNLRYRLIQHRHPSDCPFVRMSLSVRRENLHKAAKSSLVLITQWRIQKFYGQLK